MKTKPTLEEAMNIVRDGAMNENAAMLESVKSLGEEPALLKFALVMSSTPIPLGVLAINCLAWGVLIGQTMEKEQEIVK